VLNLGLPDQIVEHGSHEEQLSWTGLDAPGILQNIRQVIQFPREAMLSEIKVRDAIEMPR
jgi:deoxyxylulose-5-phosphate synthase